MRGKKYKLLKDITYTLSNGTTFVVPKRFRTNGADIPRMFWSAIPPNLSDILPAVVLHDYLCDVAKFYYKLTGDKDGMVARYVFAAVEFKHVLEDLKINHTLISILYKSVYYYSAIAPYANKKELKQNTLAYYRNKIKAKDSLNPTHKSLLYGDYDDNI